MDGGERVEAEGGEQDKGSDGRDGDTGVARMVVRVGGESRLCEGMSWSVSASVMAVGVTMVRDSG